MENGLMAGVAALLHWLAIPEVGLSAVFVIAFVSATLLPMGSEPAVFGWSSCSLNCSGQPSWSPRWAIPWVAP